MAKPLRTPDAGLALIDRYQAAVIESRMERLDGAAWTRPTFARERAAVTALPAPSASDCGPTTSRGHIDERRGVQPTGLRGRTGVTFAVRDPRPAVTRAVARLVGDQRAA